MVMKRTPINPKCLTSRRKGTPTPRIKAGRVEDPRHLKAVRSLPCVVCAMLGIEQTTQTEAHHPREGQGMSQKADDHLAISLCESHHRTGKDAFHMGPARFAERFGSHQKLLDKVMMMLQSGEYDLQ